MRTTTIIAFITITLASSASVGAQGTTIPGCVGLYEGTCGQCYKRKVLETGNGCGPVLPATDKCILYSYNKNVKQQQCAACAEGYAEKIQITNSTNTTKITTSCVKGSLDNCIIEGESEGARFCYACDKGLYSVLNKTAKTGTCQKVDNPVPNCLWGSFVQPAAQGGPHCIRCVNGFAVDLTSGKCEAAVVAGCWTQQAGKCVACNPFTGYSATTDGGCAKNGAALEGDLEAAAQRAIKGSLAELLQAGI